MAVVRAGKFRMCLISWVIATDPKGGLDPKEARKQIFKGITGVRGTPEEFASINEMLEQYPIFKKFEIGAD